MVPEYHVMRAASEANYKYYSAEWQELSWQERTNIVALYFAKMMVHNHSEDAQATEAKKRAQKAEQANKG